MRFAVVLLLAVSFTGVVFARGEPAARGKQKEKKEKKGKEPKEAAPAPAAAAPAAAAQAEVKPTKEALQKALALPTAKFEDSGLYTITTMVGGTEYALTFITPSSKPLTNNGSISSVELRKLTGGPEQQWQPTKDTEKAYLLWSRISDFDERLTGVMVLYNPSVRFVEDDKFYAKYNRISVTPHQNSNEEMWLITQLENGKFRMLNGRGRPEVLNKPGDEWPEYWNDSRWLEAVPGSPNPKLRFRLAAETPAQEWTFTKVGTVFFE